MGGVASAPARNTVAATALTASPKDVVAVPATILTCTYFTGSSSTTRATARHSSACFLNSPPGSQGGMYFKRGIVSSKVARSEVSAFMISSANVRCWSQKGRPLKELHIHK